MEANGLGMDAISNETVDLEHIPVEEVFEHLKCTREGLTADAAQQRINIFGYNKLEEKQESKLLKFLGFMWNPLSWVMEAAALMAIALAHGGKDPAGNKMGIDFHDFVGIFLLLIINSTISFIEENNAGNAASALMARLAPKAKVLRDGTWSELDASLLVPGDIISIKLGDIIPADARLLEGDPLKIDQVFLVAQSHPSRLLNWPAPFSEGTKESPGGPWHFIGLLPLFDPPRHDSAETIRRALHLGVSVKMITGATFPFASRGEKQSRRDSDNYLAEKKGRDVGGEFSVNLAFACIVTQLLRQCKQF